MLELAEVVKEPIETSTTVHTVENTQGDPCKRKPYITEAAWAQGRNRQEMEIYCLAKLKYDQRQR